MITNLPEEFKFIIWDVLNDSTKIIQSHKKIKIYMMYELFKLIYEALMKNIITKERFDYIISRFTFLDPVIVVGDVGIDKYTFGEVKRRKL